MELCAPLLALFFINPNPSITYPISPTTSSLPLTLHPDSVGMNIDVNYPSPQNSGSICDFPKEFAHDTHTQKYTPTKRGIMEVSICSALEQELKSGARSLRDRVVLSLKIPPSRSSVIQYGEYFMPSGCIKAILTTANYFILNHTDGADATSLWEVRLHLMSLWADPNCARFLALSFVK